MFLTKRNFKGITMFYALATRPVNTTVHTAAPALAASPLERFLNDTFTSLADSRVSRSVNVEDTEAAYTLQMDVPGVAKEHLDIGIEGDVVRIASKEGAARQVKAAWRFPLEIDPGNSSAKLENGVLMLTLGKKIPASNVSQLFIS